MRCRQPRMWICPKCSRYFAGARYSIADIALYAYTHVAHEGGFDLAPYPTVRAWLGHMVTSVES